MSRINTTAYIIDVDDQFFAPGQAYTALSRAPSWDVVEIPCLTKNAFSVDSTVLREYERLQQIATYIHSLLLHLNRLNTKYFLIQFSI